MALHLHRSNRTEALVDALARVVRTPLADPLEPEYVVVQGRGMERWLSMQLADRLGAWANPAFPFPRRAIDHMLDAFLGTASAGPAVFELPALGWAVGVALPELLTRPAFAPIRRYVGDDPTHMRLVELADRIAATFDRYLVYRPELIRSWEAGADRDWQAELWRALVARHGHTHLAGRAAALLALAPDAAPTGLPERISVFGLSSLPPLYLQILGAAARWRDVHLFLLSPSREFWGDVRPPQVIARAVERAPAGGDDLLHFEEGHPLVASLGRLGRDLLELLEDAGGYVDDPTAAYADPPSETMLAALQGDMLALELRGGDAGHACGSNDASIAIHACHGPMREVEVLHDQLLAAFDADPTLQPHEVLVMSPSIDEYAPYIDAVFGSSVAPDARPAFRYRIADRTVRATDPIYDAFCRTLDLVPGRFTASEVVDVLELAPVRERAGMATADVELVRRWLQSSGIRWGVDEQHRTTVGYPSIRETTWRFGLDRLLLGCALRGRGSTMFGGVLPADDVDGNDSVILGRMVELCDVLFHLREDLQTPRPLADWAHALGNALDALIGRETRAGQTDEAVRIRQALERLGRGPASVGFDLPVGLPVARLALDRELREHDPPLGFLGGGITFCAMVPMRSIPFRIVALLGMNDDTFPRRERPLDFDRTTRDSQLGDRSVRDDDRYTFLEALLSARERLLITYVGQSIRDNTPLPPSVVVSELLDVLERSFRPPPGHTTVREYVRVQHRLQPFNPAYFTNESPALFSYARAACAGAERLRAGADAPPPLVPHPLPLRTPAPLTCTVDQLTTFLEHPIRGFLREQLGLLLGRDLLVLDDREPATLEPLDEWSIGHTLLERFVRVAEPPRDLDASVRATGELPPGALGALHLAEILPRVTALAEHVGQLRRGSRLPPLDIDTRVGDVQLVGTLDGLWPETQLHHQYSKLGRNSELRLWIRHLVLGLVAPAAYPHATVIVGRDAEGRPALCRFRPVAEPEPLLGRLADLYVRGQTEPLVFFPATSRAYVEALHGPRPASPDEAIRQARSKFGTAESEHWTERDDPYIQQIHRETDPFGTLRPLFERTALTVFEPLLAHREQS